MMEIIRNIRFLNLHAIKNLVKETYEFKYKLLYIINSKKGLYQKEKINLIQLLIFIIKHYLPHIHDFK